MAYKNRWPKRGPNKWKPYKNQFEHDLHKVLKNCEYEDKDAVVAYETKAKYNPDFTFKSKPWLLIEAKGRFMGGSKEAAKYVWVKRCNPQLEIVFIFTNINNKAYPGCRRRKDGSFLTMGEWASKNEFLAFGHKNLPTWLIDGSMGKETYRAKLNIQREMYGMKPINTPIPFSIAGKDYLGEKG